MDWSEKGINVGGKRLNNLKYAENIVIIANDTDQHGGLIIIKQRLENRTRIQKLTEESI